MVWSASRKRLLGYIPAAIFVLCFIVYQVDAWVDMYYSARSSYMQPNAMTVDSRGNIYVVIGLADRVLEFSSTGKQIREVGRDEQNANPQSAGCDLAGNVYILNTWPQPRVSKYSPEGALLKRWPLITRSVQFDDDSKESFDFLAVSHGGDVYAVTTAGVTERFDSCGRFISMWGPPPGFPREAQAVALDPQGNIYVAAHKLYSQDIMISKFSDEGLFLGNAIPDTGDTLAARSIDAMSITSTGRLLACISRDSDYTVDPNTMQRRSKENPGIPVSEREYVKLDLRTGKKVTSPSYGREPIIAFDSVGNIYMADTQYRESVRRTLIGSHTQRYFTMTKFSPTMKRLGSWTLDLSSHKDRLKK